MLVNTIIILHPFNSSIRIVILSNQSNTKSRVLQSMTDSTMPPSTRPLTLIVAANFPSLGIGRNGALPWRLKAEMAYFARVTKRVPGATSTQTPSPRNAVIMGRRTWESIPPKFRPLKDRVNIVLSRSGSVDGITDAGEDVLLATGLEDAVAKLDAKADGSARAFVIGGSSVYDAALKLQQTKRVLLTKVYGEFECDTFFPVDLEGEEGKRLGWRKADKKGLEEYVGEEVEARVKEGDIEFEYCLYERD
jgi:dihydrofolate reductase